MFFKPERRGFSLKTTKLFKNHNLYCNVLLLFLLIALSACGRTALMKAAGIGDTDKVKALLDEGGDINAKSPSGATALMMAAFKGHTSTVEVLLDRGADINAKCYSLGLNALMVAAENGHHDTAKTLLDHGADVNARNLFGKTALTIATNKNHTKVIQLLKQAGAKEE